MPDLGGYGVIVYSLKDNDSWRVNHHYFHFDPLAGQYKVGGIQFEWTDGVFSLALSKSDSNGYIVHTCRCYIEIINVQFK